MEIEAHEGDPSRPALAAILPAPLDPVADLSHSLPMPPSSPSVSSPWPAFACVALGVFMATLDSSIVNVALPSILLDFGSTLSTVEWVANIYLLVITGLLLAFGRLADLVGHKRVFIGGLATFTLGSAFCAAAPGPHSLIAARALQGTGGAMLMACSPAVITAVFPPEHRGQGLGLVGTTVALGLVSGPPLGGVLLGLGGWRSVFIVNLPVGVIAVLLALKLLPRLRMSAAADRYDLAGAALFTAACASGLLALNQFRNWGLLAVPVGIAALLFLWAFVAKERRTPSPLVDPKLFHNRNLTAALTAAALSYQAAFVAILLLPFYLTQVRGLSPSRMGAFLTVPPLVMSLLAPWAGSLSDRLGYARLTAAGLWLRVGSFALLIAMGASTPYPWLALALALLGAGSALFNPPNTSSIMGSVEPGRLGTAGGLAAVARNLGMCLGIASGSAVFSSVFRAAGGTSLATYVPEQARAFSLGWRSAMSLGLTLSLLALFASSRRSDAPSPNGRVR